MSQLSIGFVGQSKLIDLIRELIDRKNDDRWENRDALSARSIRSAQIRRLQFVLDDGVVVINVY